MAALLAIPMLTLMSVGVIARMARSIGLASRGPTQFYYDHVLLLTSLIGALLAYWVCETLSSRSAVWVWIPAVIAFAIRIVVWLSTGSVPTGSVLFRESVIQHFFTVDCPQAAYCPDQLMLTPWLLGPVAYSVGAALQRFVAPRRRPHAPQP